MSTTVLRVVRTLMIAAALLSSVPSFEGMVLCWCGDSTVEIESGTSRCSALPVLASPAAGAGATAMTDSHCGPCVDVPLLSPGSGIGRSRTTSLELLDALSALVPARIFHGIVDPVAAAPAALRPLAVPPSSPTTTPLRC